MESNSPRPRARACSNVNGNQQKYSKASRNRLTSEASSRVKLKQAAKSPRTPGKTQSGSSNRTSEMQFRKPSDSNRQDLKQKQKQLKANKQGKNPLKNKAQPYQEKDGGEADEEDNSNREFQIEEQHQVANNQIEQAAKRATKRLSVITRKSKDQDLIPSPSQNSIKSSSPEMVDRDLSPLSPMKRNASNKSQAEHQSQNSSRPFGGLILQRVSPRSEKSELQKSSGNSKQEGQQLNVGEVIPAYPILPKQYVPEKKAPPKCPIKEIQFINLKPFLLPKERTKQMMGEGYDMIGKKNMMRENFNKNRKFEDEKRGRGQADEAKIDEFTNIISNIVYARDPRIFDNKNGWVYQKEAFMHENMLDVKNLVRQNLEKSNPDKLVGLRSPSPKKPTRYVPKFFSSYEELQSKANFELKKLESGEIDPSDNTLLFESRFESGNLYLAQKVSDSEYNLLMQNDINTNGHTQWFFFRVTNTRKNNKVKFNLMNYYKPDSIFNYGHKVSVYSETRADQDGVGWFKAGERISYLANPIKKEVNNTSRSYYTASFTYTFKHDNDVVYFAYAVPYTYSDLSNDLFELEQDPRRRQIFSRKLLCKTLGGNDCEVLTITEKGDLDKMKSKKGIVLSARVHPGEVVGSWMMRGVLQFLTDPDNEEAKMLRENFIIKVIPMLNPDGVINGNYRCSLAGCDLNRRWRNPSKNLHPTIFYTKKLILDTERDRGLALYCDLHGHSRKQNVFMYGCDYREKPEACRVFPLILSKLSPFFCFESCRFGVQKSKESTARVSLFKEIEVCPNIFTMESTFAGIDKGEFKGQFMDTVDFERMGKDLCRTLLVSENIHVPPELEHLFGKKQEQGDQFETQPSMAALFANELKENEELMNAGAGDSSGGSDSEPSEDNLPIEEVSKFIPMVDKQQKLMLQRALKKKAEEEKQRELDRKSPVKKKPEEPPKPQPRQKSPTKRPEPNEKKDKKKPEMKDACTQTERSDLQRIKKMQEQKRLQKIKEEQMKLRAEDAQRQQKSHPSNMLLNQPPKRNPNSQTGQRDSKIELQQNVWQTMRPYNRINGVRNIQGLNNWQKASPGNFSSDSPLKATENASRYAAKSVLDQHITVPSTLNENGPLKYNQARMGSMIKMNTDPNASAQAFSFPGQSINANRQPSLRLNQNNQKSTIGKAGEQILAQLSSSYNPPPWQMSKPGIKVPEQTHRNSQGGFNQALGTPQKGSILNTPSQQTKSFHNRQSRQALTDSKPNYLNGNRRSRQEPTSRSTFNQFQDSIQKRKDHLPQNPLTQSLEKKRTVHHGIPSFDPAMAAYFDLHNSALNSYNQHRQLVMAKSRDRADNNSVGLVGAAGTRQDPSSVTLNFQAMRTNPGQQITIQSTNRQKKPSIATPGQLGQHSGLFK